MNDNLRHAGWTRLAALALFALLIPGCAFTSFSRTLRLPVAAPTAEEGPRLSGTDRKLLDCAEQAALAPAEPYWPFHAAEVHVEADSLGRAEASLKAALTRDARYAPALALLSRLYYDSRRHEDGVRLLEPVCAPGATPEGAPAELLAALALHYDALDRVDDAAALMRAAGTRGGAQGAAAYLVLRGERPDSGRASAERAVDENGKSAANHNNLGIVRLRAGDADGARQSFLRAIGLDPRLAGPYYNLAILEKFYRFDDEAAAKWFHSYWERSHDDPDSLRAQIETTEPKKLAKEASER